MIRNGCVLLLFTKTVSELDLAHKQYFPNPIALCWPSPLAAIPTSLFIMIIAPTLTLAIQHLYLASVISESCHFHYYQRARFCNSICSPEPQLTKNPKKQQSLKCHLWALQWCPFHRAFLTAFEKEVLSRLFHGSHSAGGIPSLTYIHSSIWLLSASWSLLPLPAKAGLTFSHLLVWALFQSSKRTLTEV